MKEVRADDDAPKVLRLRRRHEGDPSAQPDPVLGERLVAAQSPGLALLAAALAVIVFIAFWVALSDALGRIFPWFSLVLGVVVGLVVRRAGHGVDWRFPLLAAIATVIGAVAGNIIVGAAFEAAELNTTTWTVLLNVTSMTWDVYFDEVVNPADVIFAFTGAALAAYYANRRLNRKQANALRAYLETAAHD